MVDELHPSEPHGTPPGGRPPSGPGWLGKAILGALGLTALINYLLGRRATGEYLPVPADQVRGPGALMQPLPDEVTHSDGRIAHPNVSYERTDASLGWIVGLIVGAMGFAAFVHWIMLVFFYDYKGYQADIKRPNSPLVSPSDPTPPRPRLEQVDREFDKDKPANVLETDIMAMEATKLRVLESYGLTEQGDYVHIPIQEAMAMVGKDPAKHNAPYRNKLSPELQKTAKWQRGLMDAGESNSGRMPRREPRWFAR